MNLHDADLKSRLTRLLARKSPPKLLDGNHDAQSDEVTALVATLRRAAPRDPDRLPDWWQVFEPAMSETCGRMWPTEKEIAQVGRSINERLRQMHPAPQSTSQLDPAEMTARRMAKGEAVGEGWLYGAQACEMIARGLVDEETMRKYRSAAYFRRKGAYGEENALQWEDEAKTRHEHGRAVWKSREEARQSRIVAFPDKRSPTARMEMW